ncbi:MAG TPA: hypothetical protein VL633_07000 [Bacteroidota bacterium]|jgi:hypothetical protein|nr:hypothetical protein [Bacteroidota bacterium]
MIPVSSSNLYKIIFVVLALAGLLIGGMYASQLKFVNDDAFISFRYARNAVNGFGLVYNVGEKVEGYTNFLWTMLIAAGMKLQIEPVKFSEVLGIFFYLCTLSLFCAISWKLNPRRSSGLFVIPLTAVCLAVHRDFSVYATSGLETSFYTFLISALFACMLFGRSRTSLLLSGFIVVLAMMTRPDGIIFLMASAFYVVLKRKNVAGNLFALFLPVVLLFLPYWFWRYSYFGAFFPNTYYAKSIDQAYYARGIWYVIVYVQTYYILLLIPVIGFIYLVRKIRSTSQTQTLNESWKEFSEGSESHPFVLSALFILIQLFYVIRIGGDFMFARFLIPITPMLFFALEQLTLRQRKTLLYVSLCAAVIAGTAFRNNLFYNRDAISYIADEFQWYPDSHLERAKAQAAMLRKMFEGIPVRVGFIGEQAQLMYYLDPALAIECAGGLTDSAIAHQKISVRGRPGHEKHASLEYLQKRRVQFLFDQYYQLPTSRIPRLVTFNNFAAYIITYDDSVMSRLASNKQIAFVDFKSYLDSYITRADSLPAETVQEDFQSFQDYYFRYNNDPARENALTMRLNTTR